MQYTVATAARNALSAVALAFVFLAVQLAFDGARPASADNPYIGNGQWSTSSLTYYFYGPNGTYQSPTQAAATDWNDMSDLTFTSTAEGWEKIGVATGAYAGAFNGRTTICVLGGGCYSSLNPALDNTYSYAQIDYDTDSTSGWSWGDLRALANHELGHAFSLWHSPYCDPDHIMYPSVTHSCNGSIMSPDSHAITGVNARY